MLSGELRYWQASLKAMILSRRNVLAMIRGEREDTGEPLFDMQRRFIIAELDRREDVMGNHDVGRAMLAASRAYWLGRGEQAPPTQSEALLALDVMAEDYKGADAEFDDALDTVTPLSRLVAIAFDATDEEISGLGDPNEGGDAWHDGPHLAFCERFEFS